MHSLTQPSSHSVGDTVTTLTGTLKVKLIGPFLWQATVPEITILLYRKGDSAILEGKANAQGEWQMELPPGEYVLSAGEQSQDVEIEAGKTTELTLNLGFVGHRQRADFFDQDSESQGTYMGPVGFDGMSHFSPRPLQPEQSASQPAFFSACSAGARGASLHKLTIASANTFFGRHAAAYHEGRETYGHTQENTFLDPASSPVSTFSVDVDTASYANVRRMIQQGQRPPADAVRLEEFLNYFDYEYPAPSSEHPLEIYSELAACPWAEAHRLLLVGLQGKRLDVAQLPPSHLVLLLDVSGSMGEPDKLPLLQQALRLFIQQLRDTDRVSVVTYANDVKVALPPTLGSEKEKIRSLTDSLTASGGTSGGPALQTAYRVAREQFVFGGNNRILLCTDGDFNIGPSSDGELMALVEKERQGGVYLSILGFGMGNFQDHKLQQIANKGNGNYHYVDSLLEARKVLVEEFAGTVFTIADNVKMQVEFNPARVAGYRLLGYEKRLLRREDFNDDSVDAAEVGAGHRVTALYEVVPTGLPVPGLVPADGLKYQQPLPSPTAAAEELLTLKLRYILPGSGTESRLLERALADRPLASDATSDNFRLASAVAGFAMLLRDSKHKGGMTWALARQLAASTLRLDPNDYRKELCLLLRSAELQDL